MEQPAGSPQEESIFEASDFSTRRYEKKIRNARIILFIIACAHVLAIFTTLKMPEPEIWFAMGIDAVVALVFFALAFWTKQKPYTALLTAIIVYVSLIVIGGIVDPSTQYKGLFIKIIFIVMLIQGIRDGKQAQDLKETFEKGQQ
jgi:hypothetical protein